MFPGVLASSFVAGWFDVVNQTYLHRLDSVNVQALKPGTLRNDRDVSFSGMQLVLLMAEMKLNACVVALLRIFAVQTSDENRPEGQV